MKIRMLALMLAAVVLTGCTSLLEREYSVASPHSSKFWESGATATLRAENRQDIVNDLLLLIGQHTEKATIRLYNYDDDLMVSDVLDRAIVEVRQDTAMGAYAVEFITATTAHKQRVYYEIEVQISYRRTAEQIQSVTNATSPEAIYSLLQDALDAGETELVVRVGYWGTEGKDRLESALVRLREERKLTEEDKPWLACYYPQEGPVGLVELILDPTEEQIAKMQLTEKTPDGGEHSGENADPVEDGVGEAQKDGERGVEG